MPNLKEIQIFRPKNLISKLTRRSVWPFLCKLNLKRWLVLQLISCLTSYGLVWQNSNRGISYCSTLFWLWNSTFLNRQMVRKDRIRAKIALKILHLKKAWTLKMENVKISKKKMLCRWSLLMNHRHLLSRPRLQLTIQNLTQIVRKVSSKMIL